MKPGTPSLETDMINFFPDKFLLDGVLSFMEKMYKD